MVKRLPFAFGLLAVMVIGCLSDPATVTNSAAGDEAGSPVVSHRTLTAHGGRVNITKSPGTWEEHAEPSPGAFLVTFNSSRSFDWRNPPDTAKTLRLELWARQVSTGNVFRLTDFNRQLEDRGRVLTSDYAWSPSGREIAVYYAIFGRGSITQKIDILRLDRAY
jgi:hypothetical protein